MTLSRRDKVVALILVLIILLLIYLMQCHWRNRFGARGDAKPVGEVEYKYHQVQRKYSDRMLWEDVESKSPIFAYDWVMTKDKSDARITLNNGMKVDMDPESMVEIDESREGVGLTLRDGTIRADSRAAKGGTITAADGTKIDLDQADAQISTGSNGLSVDVKSGNATLKSQGKEAKVAAGEVGSMNKEGFSKEKTRIVLKSPAQGAVLEDASKAVQFSFDAPAGAEDCKIQLTGGKQRRTLSAGRNSHSAVIADGSYQWRVICRQGEKNISSAAGAFRVRPASTFALISPSRGQVIPANQAENLALHWRGGGRVKVDVSRNADFSSPVKSVETGGDDLSVAKLKPGTYYWRVAPVRDKTQSIQSNFVISDKGELLAEADSERPAVSAHKEPKDTDAAKKKKASEAKTEKVRISASAPRNAVIEPDAVSANVKIGWTPVNKAHSYRIRIAKDREFDEQLSSETVSGKGQATLALKPGAYYLRVDVTRRGSNKVLASSKTQRIDVKKKKLPPPPRVKSVQAD